MTFANPGRSPGPAAATLAAYVALAILQTWPLVLHLHTHLPGPGLGDNVSFVWNLWWMREAIGSSAWTRTGASVFYGGTVTTTRTAGVALTRPGVTARQVFVLATTCSSCGSVAVYVGSTKVGTLSLTSSTTRSKVMLSTTLFMQRSGPLKLVSTTAGKPVYVDAFAVRSR